MLILVRHGQSTYNVDKKFSGALNVPLTPLGREQAVEAGKSLENTPIDVMFASKLDRSKDTAWAIIAEQKKAPNWVFMDEGALNERSYGLIDGLTLSEARSKFPPKKYKQWDRDYFEAPPMGESYSDVSDRLIPFYTARILPWLKSGNTVCVVCHATVMRVLIGYLNHLDEAEVMNMNIENAIPYELSLSTLGI